jgi:hypothetical protein
MNPRAGDKFSVSAARPKKSEFLPRYENKQTVYPSGLCRAGLVIG